jgi:hypothetical protein
LTRDAKVFGGDVLTATDIAVRSGVGGIGDAMKVECVSDEIVTQAKKVTKKLLEVCWNPFKGKSRLNNRYFLLERHRQDENQSRRLHSLASRRR